LGGPIPAGTWHLVGDGIVIQSCVIRYEVLWRHDGSDTTLFSVSHDFDPLKGSGQFDATPFETDVAGEAAPAHAGDQLVWRFSTDAGDAGTGVTFVPNGDGMNSHGRIPSLTLPR
jgi:hypothetical protein